MMDKLISQFEVIRAIEKYVNNIFTKNMGDLINDIKAIPSAEPKAGHWIITYPYGKQNPIYECPHCHASNSSVFKNFCPNCGAKMVEPQESEEV